jgi:hypothetical protein
LAISPEEEVSLKCHELPETQARVAAERRVAGVGRIRDNDGRQRGAGAVGIHSRSRQWPKLGMIRQAPSPVSGFLARRLPWRGIFRRSAKSTGRKAGACWRCQRRQRLRVSAARDQLTPEQSISQVSKPFPSRGVMPCRKTIGTVLRVFVPRELSFNEKHIFMASAG